MNIPEEMVRIKVFVCFGTDQISRESSASIFLVFLFHTLTACLHTVGCGSAAEALPGSFRCKSIGLLTFFFLDYPDDV